MVDSWEKIDSKIYVHSKYRKIEDATYIMPDGKKKTFNLKLEGDAVTTLPIDTNGNVILARQYRPGPDMVVDELPGGGKDVGETPLDGAKRELLEETGYASDNWIFLCNPLNCAYSTSIEHAYLALDCYKVSEQNLDDGEHIDVVIKTIPDFIKQLSKGLCGNADVGWIGLYTYLDYIN